MDGYIPGFHPETCSRNYLLDVIVLRAVDSHQRGQNSNPAWCHMWVEFVSGSRPSACSEAFSLDTHAFLPPGKSTFLNVSVLPG